MPSDKLPKGLTGVAGEYFVAAELSVVSLLSVVGE